MLLMKSQPNSCCVLLQGEVSDSRGIPDIPSPRALLCRNEEEKVAAVWGVSLCPNDNN